MVQKAGTGKKGAGGEEVAAGTAQQLLFCEGEAAATAAATATDADVSRGRWMMYRSADAVKRLMAWLHSNGERERTLKARLKQARSPPCACDWCLVHCVLLAEKILALRVVCSFWLGLHFA